MNEPDEIPDWGEGERLEGDAYVEWIRSLRETPNWAVSALKTEGVSKKRVEEGNQSRRENMANPKQILLVRTSEETNGFDNSKVAWGWLKNQFEKYHDDEGMHRKPRIKGTMDYTKADRLWFNAQATIIRKAHKQSQEKTFDIIRKGGGFLASVSCCYCYKKGAFADDLL